MDNNLLSIMAYRTFDLLNERKALITTEGKAFWVWPREDRVILVFDPTAIDLGKVNDDFAHRLSTRLAGRRVVRTNSRGLFIQVGYGIPIAPVELTAQSLDLSKQPSPFHMPVGSTANGDLWISLLEGDSFFVVGARGFGKTGELHGFIQALLNGKKTLIFAWDGKENAEYLRYVGRENFTLLPMNGLQDGLKAIQDLVKERMTTLVKSGHPNILSYNESGVGFIQPIALIVDEVAEVENQDLLLKQVKVNRAAGVFPIFATNDPSKSSVVAKSNLGTRISFPVVSTSDSIMGLGRPGANKISKVRGRGLIEQGGRLVEFQSFTVEYAKPTEAGLQWLIEHVGVGSGELIIEPNSKRPVDVSKLAESIRAQWSPELSKRAVGRLLKQTYAGSWANTIDEIVSYLSATTTTKGAQAPEIGQNPAFQ